ncbi:unnamed protein product [Ostreobium quekettii]|uniref:Uncharacterized protein n=1 Tax=Ostreobium quekettii TaxID=121088 RepID=A0A8S1IZS6_9CHLO|nr:unnamed protein product [Ostreobium quekettii]
MEEMLHQMVDICAADLVKKQADFLLYWGNGQELGVHKFTAREDYEYTWWIRHQPNGGFADAWHFEVEYGSDGQTANPAEEIDLANANNTFRVAFLTPRAQEMLVANLTERGFQAEFRVQSVMCDSRELPGQTVQGNVQLVTIKW